MRGGQYVNNWRMAELHAKERRPGARARGWGPPSIAPKDGKIPAAQLRRAPLSASGPRRDRTGLELIRTLQDHGIHLEWTYTWNHRGRPAHRRRAHRRRGRLHARPRVFKVFRAKAVILATGGLGRAYKITSNSWECTGDGHTLAYDAGAELIDWSSSSSIHRHGLAAIGARHPGHRGGAR